MGDVVFFRFDGEKTGGSKNGLLVENYIDEEAKYPPTVWATNAADFSKVRISNKQSVPRKLFTGC